MLTRCLQRDRQDCWQVFYGDVCVGLISLRSGVPNHVDQWEWGCGFYPGTDPGEGSGGTAATFEAARADFEAAWRTFLPTRTEADFQAWRNDSDWTMWKYAMWDAGLKMPTQIPSRRSRCFCGAEIDIRGTHQHVRDARQGPVATRPSASGARTAAGCAKITPVDLGKANTPATAALLGCHALGAIRPRPQRRRGCQSALTPTWTRRADAISDADRDISGHPKSSGDCRMLRGTL